MMKKLKCLVLLSVILASNVSAQFIGADFTLSVATAVYNHPLSAAAGDLNGDGKNDLVISGGYDRKIKVYINESTVAGTTSLNDAIVGEIKPCAQEFDPTTVPLANEIWATSIKIFDADGDGSNDIVVVGRENALHDNYLYIYKNIGTNASPDYGTGNPTHQLSCVDANGPTGFAKMDIGDLDKDGDIDIAVKKMWKSNTYALINKSTPGNFLFTKLEVKGVGVGSDVDGIQRTGIKIMDFTKDGKKDVMYSADGCVLFLPSTTTGVDNFSHGAEKYYNYTANKILKNVQSLDAADFDNDGDNDYVITGDSIMIGKNKGTGDLSTLFDTLIIDKGSKFKQVIATDFDKDGKIDLAVIKWISSASSSILLYKNITTVADAIKFAPALEYAAAMDDDPQEMITADFNIDGKADVLVLYNSSFKILSNNFAIPGVSYITPVGGAKAGTTVTLIGAGLMGTTFVTFKNASGYGTPVAAVVIDDNTVTCVVPADAETGKIKVTNVTGTYLQDAIFTLTKTEIKSVTPVSVYPGDTITVSGTNLNGATKIVFTGGIQSTNLINLTMTSFKVKVPSGATTGVVTLTVDGADYVSPSPLTITVPKINLIDPLTLISPGGTFYILGVNLGLVSELKVGSIICNINTFTSTKLTCSVPMGTLYTKDKVTISVKGIDYKSTDDLTIGKALIFSAIPDKTYGDTFTLTATSAITTIPITFSSSNPTIASIIEDTVYTHKVGTVTITATQGTEQVDQSLTIKKAALTISADNKTKKSGEINPTFTATFTGFKNSDKDSDLTSPLKFKCIANDYSPAANYDIEPWSAIAANYDITFVTGLLIVTSPPNISLTNESIADLSAYPNPFTEAITIKYSLVKDGEVRFEFYNDLGQKTAEKLIKQLAGNNETTFIASDLKLTSGISFVKVIVGSDVAIVKLINQ